jgi:hypothetical protein
MQSLEIIQNLAFVFVAAGAPAIIAGLAHADLQFVEVDQFNLCAAVLQALKGGVGTCGGETVSVGAGGYYNNVHQSLLKPDSLLQK